jgi:hypothetical protein
MFVLHAGQAGPPGIGNNEILPVECLASLTHDLDPP